MRSAFRTRWGKLLGSGLLMLGVFFVFSFFALSQSSAAIAQTSVNQQKSSCSGIIECAKAIGQNLWATIASTPLPISVSHADTCGPAPIDRSCRIYTTDPSALPDCPTSAGYTGSCSNFIIAQGPMRQGSCVKMACPPAQNLCDTRYQNDRFHACYFSASGSPPTIPMGNDVVLAQEDDGILGSNPLNSYDTQNAFDHQWGEGVVGSSGKTDGVGVIWRGNVNFAEGNYTFYTSSDDGIVVMVDGSGDIISNWTDHGTYQNSASIYLPAGRRNVTVKYYENTGGAVVKFWWQYIAPPSPQSTDESIQSPSGTSGYHTQELLLPNLRVNTWIIGRHGCSLSTRLDKAQCENSGKWNPTATAVGWCNVLELGEADCNAKPAYDWLSETYVADRCMNYDRTSDQQTTDNEYWCKFWRHTWEPHYTIPERCSNARWNSSWSSCIVKGYWHPPETVQGSCSYFNEKNQTKCQEIGTWYDELDHCSDGSQKTLEQCRTAAQDQMRVIPETKRYCASGKCVANLNVASFAEGGDSHPVAHSYRAAGQSSKDWLNRRAFSRSGAGGYCVDNICASTSPTTFSIIKDESLPTEDMWSPHKLVTFQIQGDTVEYFYIPDEVNVPLPNGGEMCECSSENNCPNSYSPYETRVSKSPNICYSAHETDEGDIFYSRYRKAPRYEIDSRNLLDSTNPNQQNNSYTKAVCFGSKSDLQPTFDVEKNIATYKLDITGELRTSSNISPRIACNIIIRSPKTGFVKQFDNNAAGTIYQSVNFIRRPEIISLRSFGAVSADASVVTVYKKDVVDGSVKLSWDSIATTAVELTEQKVSDAVGTSVVDQNNLAKYNTKSVFTSDSPGGSWTIRRDLEYGEYYYRLTPKASFTGDQKLIQVNVIDPPLGIKFNIIPKKDGTRGMTFEWETVGAHRIELTCNSGLFLNCTKHTKEYGDGEIVKENIFFEGLDPENVDYKFHVYGRNADGSEYEHVPLIEGHVGRQAEIAWCIIRKSSGMTVAVTAACEGSPFALAVHAGVVAACTTVIGCLPGVAAEAILGGVCLAGGALAGVATNLIPLQQPGGGELKTGVQACEIDPSGGLFTTGPIGFGGGSGNSNDSQVDTSIVINSGGLTGSTGDTSLLQPPVDLLSPVVIPNAPDPTWVPEDGPFGRSDNFIGEISAPIKISIEDAPPPLNLDDSFNLSNEQLTNPFPDNSKFNPSGIDAGDTPPPIQPSTPVTLPSYYQSQAKYTDADNYMRTIDITFALKYPSGEIYVRGNDLDAERYNKWFVATPQGDGSLSLRRAPSSFKPPAPYQSEN